MQPSRSEARSLADESVRDRPRPLTIGSAGHIDHGKTTLVAALTGTDTDRLVEERRRGISIELGFAELALASGRRMSLVDVPGHHRLVGAMVAGASGIDMFLLVIAADDGVMPQTREHWTALRALGIERGVIALSKCDVAEEEARILARAEAEALAPGVTIVEVSGRSGAGVEDLRRAIEEEAGRLGTTGASHDPDWPPPSPVLHLDRTFTLKGIGTVGTGTLRSGVLRRDERVRLLPSERVARARSIEVHGTPTDRAEAGQRVAVNLAGVGREDVARGDVIAAIDAGLGPSYRLDVALDFDPATAQAGPRVQVHQGTRDAPARLIELGADLAQLRLSSPLIATAGERIVIRRIAPPGTIGGGTVIDPRPRRHRADEEVVAALKEARSGSPEAILRRRLGTAGPAGLTAEPAAWREEPYLGFALGRFNEGRWRGAVAALVEAGEVAAERGRLLPAPTASSSAPHPFPPGQAKPRATGQPDRRGADVLALLDADGLQPRSTVALAEALGLSRAEVETALGGLRTGGHVVRLRGDVHYSVDRLERIVALASELARVRGSISLAELRDDLRISRKYAQAIVEHLDASKVTVRHGDRHQLRRPLGA